MERIIQCLLGVSIVLATGCANRHTMSLLEFDKSNQRQIEKSISALDISPLLTDIPKPRSTIALKSLDHFEDDDASRSNIMVEDILVQQLVEEGLSVVEENNSVTLLVIPESETDTLPQESTPLVKPADYLLSYRILEMCTNVEALDASQLVQRDARTKIHFRLKNTRTGAIDEAKSITSIVSDTISKGDSRAFGQYHFDGCYERYSRINEISSPSLVKPVRSGHIGIEKSDGFTLTADASWLISDAGVAFGPKIKMGGYKGNSFFGAFLQVSSIDYTSDFSIGAGAEFAYEIRAADIFAVGLGATLGFWSMDGFDTFDDNDDPKVYFGGPVLNLRVGKKKVFFNIDSSLLLGYGVAYSVSTGVQFLF